MNQHLLTPGQEFGGRYRIERFLAEGGFGAVYVAEQLATEAQVALKVLWPQVLGSKDAVEKFEQEARIAGRVKSEHIVRIIDAGFDEPTQMPFLVMELLVGEDLNSLVERQGALPPDLVIEYLRQVASALDKAHAYTDREGARRPIVHRDLKPENIFLSRRETGEPLIKVLDFGIAKITSSTSAVSREVKGTPLYMAFEQASGSTITPQTDVWPLGLIAFALLTGITYWKAAHSAEGSLAQLFGEVLSMPLAPPSQRLAELGRQSNLPPAFDDWFLRCVNRDPTQRFQTAGEAIVMLGDVFGIVVQAIGSRPASNLAPATTPASLSVPTHYTPMHGTPNQTPAPMHGTPNPTPAPLPVPSVTDGPTLHSAANPVVAGTQGALSVSGAVPVKRSSATLVVAGVGAITLLLGVAGIAFVASKHGAASADPAASAASAETAATSAPPQVSVAAPPVEPVEAPAASASEQPPAPTAPRSTAAPTSAKAAPPATSVAAKPEPTATKPEPTATSAAPKPTATTKKKPESAYIDR